MSALGRLGYRIRATQAARPGHGPPCPALSASGSTSSRWRCVACRCTRPGNHDLWRTARIQSGCGGWLEPASRDRGRIEAPQRPAEREATAAPEGHAGKGLACSGKREGPSGTRCPRRNRRQFRKLRPGPQGPGGSGKSRQRWCARADSGEAGDTSMVPYSRAASSWGRRGRPEPPGRGQRSPRSRACLSTVGQKHSVTDQLTDHRGSIGSRSNASLRDYSPISLRPNCAKLSISATMSG
jgi:hypothetical protein